MVIVAIMSSFILGERLYFGRILGAGVIIVGLYLVVWGKNKDGNSSNEDLKLPIKQTTDMQESSSSVQELNSVDSNNEQKL
ncbi:WAT1-related protein, partial [Cucurbita argyrosperma subsp. sororia]